MNLSERDRTPKADAIAASVSPDYAVTDLENVLPFRVDAELIGATVGRIYLREKNRLVVVTASDRLIAQLAEAIVEAGIAPGLVLDPCTDEKGRHCSGAHAEHWPKHDTECGYCGDTFE